MAELLNKPMDRRAFIGGAVLATGALAALSGCGGGGEGSKTFKFYLTEPAYIDPYNVQENQGTAVTSALFDPLVKWDWDKNEVAPLAAAELPEVSEDGMTFTFKLREGMKFHNGDAVDSAAFKRGWERCVDPTMATPGEVGYHIASVAGYTEFQSGNATEITGITCPDDLTFVVQLAEPMADFLAVCIHPMLSPVPQAALDDPASFLEEPIGNGPFKMSEPWNHNQYISLERFDDYYGDAPKLEGVYFSIQKDPDTAFNEFTAGNLDFSAIPLGRIKECIEQYGESEDGFTSEPGKQVMTGTELSTYYVVFNVDDPVASDVNLRRALSLAINRQNIVDTLFEGTREVATCIMPRSIDDSDLNDWEYSYYDKDAAIEILDQYYPADANGSRGVKMSLFYNSGGDHEDIMSCIQSDWEAVGIEVEQSTQEWASYLAGLSEGNFQVARLGWTADFPVMDNFLYPNFFSTADNNYGNYNNPDIDAAILAARAITDEEERKAAYRTVCHNIGDDVPLIPIMFYAHNYIGSDKAKLFYDARTTPHFETAEMV